MAGHLLLLDASAIAYRAFWSRNPLYRASDGLPTAAILGFMEITYRLIGDAQADPVSHAAAVFDAPGGTFRHKLYSGYKANRGTRSPEIIEQLPIMRDAARALGMDAIEAPGYEADDAIATLAERGVAAGLRVTIVSSDKDFAQLVRDGHVEIVDPMKRVRVLRKDVVEKFGVAPELVPDVQAIAGDTVDGIPGVPGIGLVKAAALVRKIGPLRAILAEAKMASGYRMSAANRLAINTHAKSLRTFLRLTTLDRNVDLGIELDALAARPISKSHIMELLRALEASERYSQMFERRGPSSDAVLAPAEPDPLSWHRQALEEREKKERLSSYRTRLTVPDLPQCGWYERRLVKGGPWVPARIWREAQMDFETEQPNGQDAIRCEVGGEQRHARDQWGWVVNHPISKTAYEQKMKLRAWVKIHAPNEPEANEDKPVDWNSVPL